MILCTCQEYPVVWFVDPEKGRDSLQREPGLISLPILSPLLPKTCQPLPLLLLSFFFSVLRTGYAEYEQLARPNGALLKLI